MKTKKIVMTFGTFDRLHPGHEYYLSEASKYGERLVTIVARDKTVLDIKGRRAQQTEDIRLAQLKDLPYIDRAILGSLVNPYEAIAIYKPDVLCFGYDQKSFNNEKLELFLTKNKLKPEIVILSPFEPERWKSSKLINQL